MNVLITFLFIFIGLGVSVNAHIPQGEEVCICDSCVDCINALNDVNCKIVKLNTSITGLTVTCINNPKNFTNKIFDCQGHTLEGGKERNTYGIFLDGKQNNTIKNCIIKNFPCALKLYNSTKNVIVNNSLFLNSYGIYLIFSSNNIMSNNTLSYPGGRSTYGIFLTSSSLNIISNNMVNLTLQGILLNFSSNNNISDNIVSHNSEGIALFNSSNNYIFNNVANLNTRGIALFICLVTIGCSK